MQKLLSSSENIPLTPEQVKLGFRKRGTTIKAWAKENGYSSNRVYRILNGLDKCSWGKGHEIAVKLGLKLDPAESHTSNAA